MQAMRALVVAALLAACASAPGSSVQGPDIVQVEAGAVRGVVEDGVRTFKGIRYAAAPVGPLRWRAPRPAIAWSGVRDAAAFGASCMQPAIALSLPEPMPPTESEPSVSEDCLFLNVWAPARATNAPVMVSFHGGGYFMGSGSWRSADGAALARDGLVVVNVNYRLGVFGFFAHPQLTRDARGEPPTNFGIQDQIAALQWVRRNIAAFGGDPNNVTIRGGSAGGASVNTLMISPLSEGLFHRAIAGSSTPSSEVWLRRLSASTPRQPEFAEQWGVNFATRAGAANLSELRAMPAGQLLEASLAPMPGTSFRVPTHLGVVLDGVMVPMGVVEAFRAGRQHQVPYMNGAADYEGRPRPSMADWATLERRLGPRRASAVLHAYDPSGALGPEVVRNMIAGDVDMLRPSRDVARDMRTVGMPGYTYVFAYVPERVRAMTPGAWHGAEYAYLFGNLDMRSPGHGAATAEDIDLSRRMRTYLVNFARTGNPGSAEGVNWASATEGTMVFSNDGPRFAPDHPRPSSQ